MIFGRKKANGQDTAESAPAKAGGEQASDEQTTGAADTGVLAGVPADVQAGWQAWDEQFSRDEGPFDISEVDLEADDVKRLDLGSLVITPFAEMNLQLQVDKERQRVQAVLVGDGSSMIEVALFGAPARSTIVPEIRASTIASAAEAKGRVAVVKGPFGAEIRRALPVQDAQGNPAMHLSRTWLVEGPSWMLRGVLMGKAAVEPANLDASLTLFEFFANLVVRRGHTPVAPGSLIPMTMPQADS